jgi:hypothetical protein
MQPPDEVPHIARATIKVKRSWASTKFSDLRNVAMGMPRHRISGSKARMLKNISYKIKQSVLTFVGIYATQLLLLLVLIDNNVQ